MRRKFNLTKLKKLHVLSNSELNCLKGGKKGEADDSRKRDDNRNHYSKSGSCPPDM